VTAFDRGGFTLADGRKFRAGAVIDARGSTAFPGMRGGWQKFVGQMLRTSAPHGLTAPIVMDGNRTQHDGFRFVYALPFSPDTVFVEDTYYSDTPDIDAPALRERIATYAKSKGWTVAEVLHEEQGCCRSWPMATPMACATIDMAWRGLAWRRDCFTRSRAIRCPRRYGWRR
jgi:lycopene beta-cyclase